MQNESKKEVDMKLHIYFLVLAPFALVGCAEEPVTTTTTTTEVTREVTTGPPGAPVTREVVVTQAPPAIRVETQTISPGPTYVWQKGYWSWTGTRYAWVPGHWVARPRVAAVWVEGHWTQRGAGWVWIPGHWQ